MPALNPMDGGNWGAPVRPNEPVQVDQEGHMKKVLLWAAVIGIAALPSVADAAKRKAPPPAKPAEASVPVLGPIFEGFTKLPRMAINDMRK